MSKFIMFIVSCLLAGTALAGRPATGVVTLYGHYSKEYPFVAPLTTHIAEDDFYMWCDMEVCKEYHPARLDPHVPETAKWRQLETDIVSIIPSYEEQISTITTESDHYMVPGVYLNFKTGPEQAHDYYPGQYDNPKTWSVGYYQVQSVPTANTFTIKIGDSQPGELYGPDELEIWGVFAIFEMDSYECGTPELALPFETSIIRKGDPGLFPYAYVTFKGISGGSTDQNC